MGIICGGMEFPIGKPTRLPSPPETIAPCPIEVRLPRKPSVVEGQSIRAGQRLISDESGRWSVVSPVDGRVGKITPLDRREASITPGFTLKIDSIADAYETSLGIDPPSGRLFKDWLEALRQLGTWPGRDGWVGFERQIDAAAERPPQTIICVGLDEFSPFAYQSSLLMSFPDDAVLGTLMLGDLIGIKNAMMLAANYAQVVSTLKPSCRKLRLRLKVTPPIYPASDPTVVAWSHGQRQYLPFGTNPVDAGLMLISPWTAIRFARWVTRRRIDLVQPVMIVGSKRSSQPSIRYTIAGCSLSSLDADLGQALGDQTRRVILGNPLTGQEVIPFVFDNQARRYVLTADTSVICVLQKTQAPTPQPCVSCGWCNETCPTGLEPIRLVYRCQEQVNDKALIDSLRSCIDCGLCSYVCPSAIPIAQTLRNKADQLGLANGNAVSGP